MKHRLGVPNKDIITAFGILINHSLMARTIIGRVAEKEILANALNSSRSELIAINGRRRIGKTFLIREFYEKEIVFSMTGYSVGNRVVEIHIIQTLLMNSEEHPLDIEAMKVGSGISSKLWFITVKPFTLLTIGLIERSAFRIVRLIQEYSAVGKHYKNINRLPVSPTGNDQN